MDVIMLLPWMFSAQNGLDHGWALDAFFSERIRPWRRRDVRFRPKFDKRKRGMAAHPTLRKGQMTGNENAGGPPEFGPLQPESIEKHEAVRTPWSAAGRWVWGRNHINLTNNHTRVAF